MAYKVIWEPKGVVIRFFDSVTKEDLDHYKNEIFSNPAFDTIRYQIFDTTDILEIKVRANDAVQGAYIDSASEKSNPRCKIAAVTTEEHVTALAGLYGYTLQAPGWEFQNFSTIDDARRWVEVS